jgi:NADH-quinone oxidoreductase subunit M
VAMVQPDIKKLVAYSSVSHMGYVMIGLFALNNLGATGAVYQMLNHGVSTGALFLLVGIVYERRHTREISDFGGIAKVMPWFAAVFMIVTLSSVALPGTNGFIGEFLILLGTWKTNPWVAGLSSLGVVFGAVYMLWMFQRVMFGPVTKAENKNLQDLNRREMLYLAPLLVAIIFMGIAPNIFFRKMEPSIDRFLARSLSGVKPQGGETAYGFIKYH